MLGGAERERNLKSRMCPCVPVKHHKTPIGRGIHEDLQSVGGVGGLFDDRAAFSGDSAVSPCDPSGDHHAGQGRDAPRTARIQGRGAKRRNRDEDLRQPRLHPRLRRPRQHIPGRQHGRDPRGFPRHRGEGQRASHFLQTDGRELAVPDRERRHRLFPKLHRPFQRSDGARDPAEGAWHAGTTSGGVG